MARVASSCVLAFAGVVLGACGYTTSDFSVDDGAVHPVDSGAQETAADSADSADDTSVVDADAIVDSSSDAEEGVDAPTCSSLGGVSCGAPAVCTVSRDDPLHCSSAGTCGVACADEQYCDNGVCGCRPGLIPCAGTCVDIAGDENHCGTCPGDKCNGSKRCGEASCGTGLCPAGRTLCGNSCWDLQGDPTHCGSACGSTVVCAAGELCIGGVCDAYHPAVGCTSVAGCDCTALMGTAAMACPPLSGSTDGVPICVVGTTFCPSAPWS